MATVDEFIKDAQNRMDASVEHTRTEFHTVRTGRASAALLDRVQIDYYGQQTPLKQLATINVPEPRMLTIQPFDPTSIKAIEKALLESDLGLTPSNDGKLIRRSAARSWSRSYARSRRREGSRCETFVGMPSSTSRTWRRAKSERTTSTGRRNACRS